MRWLLAETTVVLVGLALSAVQLLPTTEAAGESSRARGMGQSWSLDGAKAAATTLIGPIPDRKDEPVHWETRGGIGFGWAVFAIVGARLGGRQAIVPAAIALGMLAYALGGSYVIDRLPGFDNFRMPTRMLLTLAFPVAYLAALGVRSMNHDRARAIIRMAAMFCGVVLLNVATVSYLGGKTPWRFTEMDLGFKAYWVVITAAWALFVALGATRPAGASRTAVVLLLVTDLLLQSVSPPDTKPTEDIYPRSPIIDYIRAHNSDGQRVYDTVDWSYAGNSCLLGAGSPLASAFGVPSVRGYDPLDVRRYRQYLAYVADHPEIVAAFSSQFTHPVVADFPVQNPFLFDLLGVRYYVIGPTPRQLDRGWTTILTDRPLSYDFLGGGVVLLPPQRLLENSSVFPRSFVLANAIPQAPEAEVLDQLKAIDVRRTATIADWDAVLHPLPPGTAGPAKIESHLPNKIRIALDGQSAGLLVLTDPWYPGWKCWVDGQETKIWKADYAFRGVMVPAGSKEVVFKFEPRSYRRGRIISLAAVVGVFLFMVAVARRMKA